MKTNSCVARMTRAPRAARIMQLNATGQNLSEFDFVRSHKIAIVSACSLCKVRARARARRRVNVEEKKEKFGGLLAVQLVLRLLLCAGGLRSKVCLLCALSALIAGRSLVATRILDFTLKSIV